MEATRVLSDETGEIEVTASGTYLQAGHPDMLICLHDHSSGETTAITPNEDALREACEPSMAQYDAPKILNYHAMHNVRKVYRAQTVSESGVSARWSGAQSDRRLNRAREL